MGFITTPLIVCLVAFGLCLFIVWKPLSLAIIIGSAIQVIMMSFREYTILGDNEYFSTLVWRYAMLYVLLIYVGQDAILSSSDSPVYNRLGFIIGFSREYNALPFGLFGFAVVGILAVLLDGLIPALAFGEWFSSWRIYGIASIVFASIAAIELVPSVIKTIGSFVSRGK